MSVATRSRRRMRVLEELTKKTPPRKVNFHALRTDFLVYMLFNAGMETAGIAMVTGLTIGQVNYRILLAERKAREKAIREKREYITPRKLYRKGLSPVAKMVINQYNSKHSDLKDHVRDILDKRGLYAPQAKGVLR